MQKYIYNQINGGVIMFKFIKSQIEASKQKKLNEELEDKRKEESKKKLEYKNKKIREKFLKKV